MVIERTASVRDGNSGTHSPTKPHASGAPGRDSGDMLAGSSQQPSHSAREIAALDAAIEDVQREYVSRSQGLDAGALTQLRRGVDERLRTLKAKRRAAVARQGSGR